jgi:hypothetical protein
VVAAVLVLPVERAGASLQALVLLALVAAVALIGGALAKVLLPGVAARDRRFAAAVLGLAVCVVVGDVIGHFGALTGAWFRGVLAVLVGASALAVETEAQPLARREARRGAPLTGRRVQRLVLWAASLLVLAAFARALIRNRDVPPGWFNYDDTSYHLTAVATWNVHHDLRMPRFTFGDPRTAFYPFGSELLAWELTTPFGGGDFAARWVELPFALLTLFGTALVARRLGAGDSTLLAPLLYATVGEVWPTMAMTAGNDQALAFAALATVHGALWLRKRPRVGTAVYSGAGLGLLLATKYLGVIYAPLLVVLVVLAVATARRGHAWRRRVAALAAVAMAAAMVGGYAYLRNWVTTGNPLFPVSLRIGGWALPGWADVTPAAWSTGGDKGFDPWIFPWQTVERFGWPFRFTMLPVVFVAPIAALLLGPKRRRVLLAWLFAVPLAVYLLFVFLVEDHRSVRYLLPGLAIASVAVAWLMSRLPPRVRVVASVTLAALASARWVVDDPAVLLLLPVAGLLVWWLRRQRLSPKLRRAWMLGAALAGALGLALLAPATMRRYQERRYRSEAGAEALERLGGGVPMRVAYAGDNQPYLYCGRRLRNALFMPTDTRGGETMFYRWRGPLAEPPAQRPRRGWDRNLERLGVDWVVWQATGAGIRPEREWMLRSPERFSRVYMDERTEIWRVRR